MHTTWPRWTAGSTAHSWLCLLPGRFSRPSEGVAGVDCGRHTCSRTWGFSPPGSAVAAVSGGPALATFMERLPGGPAGTPSAHGPSCLASSLRPTKGVSSSPPGAPSDGPTGLGRGTPGGRAAEWGTGAFPKCCLACHVRSASASLRRSRTGAEELLRTAGPQSGRGSRRRCRRRWRAARGPPSADLVTPLCALAAAGGKGRRGEPRSQQAGPPAAAEDGRCQALLQPPRPRQQGASGAGHSAGDSDISQGTRGKPCRWTARRPGHAPPLPARRQVVIALSSGRGFPTFNPFL